MAIDRQEHAQSFRDLHVRGNPVVLYNVWDPGSARAVAKAGALALATGSAPVALAHGFKDGEAIPIELALDNVRRIVEAVDLPVTLDFEGGYAIEPDDLKASVQQAMSAGVVGVNFEDQIVGGEGLYAIDTQARRVAGVRAGIDASGTAGFINARTDLFLKVKPDQHDQPMLDEAIQRAAAYAEAGADGFFAPGLADEAMIAQLCEACKLPVNIIALPHVPAKARLIELGVARISYGPVPYRQMMASLEQAARTAFA